MFHVWEWKYLSPPPRFFKMCAEKTRTGRYCRWRGGEDEVWSWQAAQEMKGRKRGEEGSLALGGWRD